MARANQIQGSLDGLCGIYCLVHYLDKLPKLTQTSLPKREAAFSALLISAEKLSLLKAYNIFGGYFAADLVLVFNETARRKRLSHRAFELCTVAEAVEADSGVGLLREIFRQNGSAILSVHAGTHWVLANKIADDGRILVQDSGHSEKYRKEEVKRVGTGYDGVALLPARSAIARSLS